MPDPVKHLPGNPFVTAPAREPTAPPKHRPGNPFVLDTNPPLPGMEDGGTATATKPITGWDPLALSRDAPGIASEFAKHAASGLTTALAKFTAGAIRGASHLSPVTVLDPTDPQREDALPKAMDTRAQAGEDAAGNIRNVGRKLISRIPFAPHPTTGQKIAGAAGEITGQLAPFVAAGPAGLAAGSAMNVATELGATPEESILGMFSKEQAKSPWKRGATAAAGDAMIAPIVHYGSEAIKDYLRARRAASPDELARIGEAIPGAKPAPERPALVPSGPPLAVSESGAVGNQPPARLPLMQGKRGPVVDINNYPLQDSPAGRTRDLARDRYDRTTKGGRGGISDRSWMDTSPLTDESKLTDKVLSGQQRRLLDVAHEAADASPSGGLVVDPGHKSAAGIANKVARKESVGERPDLSALQQLGDINRVSIVVEHPNDAGPVIKHLQDTGWLKELEDKFQKPDASGYGAVHAQLVDPITGQAAELQIHTPQTWSARADLGGHDIYDYLFSKDAKPILSEADHTEARRLIEYNRNIHAEAHLAAMTGKPLKGQNSQFRLALEFHPESPDYGHWYVERRPPPGSPPDAHGERVAEADNPFKARTLLNEMDAKAAAHDNTAPPVSEIPASAPEAGATVAPEQPTPTPQTGESARTTDVPHGNLLPVNPFREIHPPVDGALQGPTGHEDVTYFGQRAVRTRYRVVEAPAAVASNDPHTFARRADYPAAIQGRVYHGSAGKGAAEQVVSGAQTMDVRRIVNPTRSIGGPPTLTPDGLVVAGNQRTMMQQRAYDLHPEKAAQLKAQIMADAQRVGIDPAEVEKMDRPMLVREITDPTVNVRDENQLRELNELSDKVTKKTKDPLSEAMGRARQLKAESGALDHYAATSSPDEPLGEYLQGPNGLKFLNKLVADKVILPAELDGFRNAATGKITKQGTTKIQDMMSAAAVGDAGIIDAAPAGIVGKLETSTPRLVQASQVDGWSLEKPLQEALELHTSRAANGQKSIAEALSQPDLLGRAETSAEGQALARFLEKNTKTKVSDAVRQWAEAAEKSKSGGGADMFGASAETPAEAFGRIFGGAREPAMVGGNRRGAVGNQGEIPKGNPHATKGNPDYIPTVDAIRFARAFLGETILREEAAVFARRYGGRMGAGIEEASRGAVLFAQQGGESPLRATGRAGSIAGPVAKDPQNYAAIKMLSSMAGTGIGSGAGATAGSKIGATPEERRRNALLGAGVGGLAGALAPFSPEIAEGVMELAKNFKWGLEPVPVQRYMGSLMDEVGGVHLDGQMSFGPPKAGAVGNQPEHIVASAARSPDGKHYTGSWHSDAIEAAQVDPKAHLMDEVLQGRNAEGNLPEDSGWKLGFETSNGRFVTREDAFQIAKDAGQEPKYVDANNGKPQLWSGTYWPKGDRPLAANRIGAVGNQPRGESPFAWQPTRASREYLAQNPFRTPAAVDEIINTKTLDLDPSGEATLARAVRHLEQSGYEKKVVSFAEQRKQADDFVFALNLDKKTVNLHQLRRLSGAEVVGLKNVLTRNLDEMGKLSKLLGDENVTVGEAETIHETLDKLGVQNQQLLGKIVTESSQMGRDLGFLRQMSSATLDPDAWVITAKRMVGDRLLSDQEVADVRRLAKLAQDACGGGA